VNNQVPNALFDRLLALMNEALGVVKVTVRRNADGQLIFELPAEGDQGPGHYLFQGFIKHRGGNQNPDTVVAGDSIVPTHGYTLETDRFGQMEYVMALERLFGAVKASALITLKYTLSDNDKCTVPFLLDTVRAINARADSDPTRTRIDAGTV
jgi:hypothetical protein